MTGRWLKKVGDEWLPCRVSEAWTAYGITYRNFEVEHPDGSLEIGCAREESLRRVVEVDWPDHATAGKGGL